MNNGITLVCDRFAYQQGSNFPIAMDQPQIVNGGQTAYSLFSTANKLAQRLEGVRIHLRVIETRDEELVRRIAFATNSQSKILDRDLRANHDIAIKLAVGLGHQNFHYKRKRGDDRDVAPDRIIDAFRSGQLIISFLGGEPHSAKSSSDHIFG